MPGVAKPQQPYESDEEYAKRLKKNEAQQRSKQRNKEVSAEKAAKLREKRAQQQRNRREHQRQPAKNQNNMSSRSTPSTPSRRPVQGEDLMSPTARSMTESVKSLASCDRFDSKEIVQIVGTIGSTEKAVEERAKAEAELGKAQAELGKSKEDTYKKVVQFDQMKYIGSLGGTVEDVTKVFDSVHDDNDEFYDVQEFDEATGKPKAKPSRSSAAASAMKKSTKASTKVPTKKTVKIKAGPATRARTKNASASAASASATKLSKAEKAAACERAKNAPGVFPGKW